MIALVADIAADGKRVMVFQEIGMNFRFPVSNSRYLEESRGISGLGG